MKNNILHLDCIVVLSANIEYLWQTYWHESTILFLHFFIITVYNNTYTHMSNKNNAIIISCFPTFSNSVLFEHRCLLLFIKHCYHLTSIFHRTVVHVSKALIAQSVNKCSLETIGLFLIDRLLIYVSAIRILVITVHYTNLYSGTNILHTLVSIMVLTILWIYPYYATAISSHR